MSHEYISDDGSEVLMTIRPPPTFGFPSIGPITFGNVPKTGLKYLWTTLEVLLRGFSLGFGARMLKFLFFPNKNDDKNDDDDDQKDTDFSRMDKEDDDLGLFVKSLKPRLFVSAISGIGGDWVESKGNSKRG